MQIWNSYFVVFILNFPLPNDKLKNKELFTYLDANNETCNLPLVLVIPPLLQWYVELVLSHFLDNKSCPKLYISNHIHFS